MIPELGHFALAFALALSVAQAAFGLVGPWRGMPRLMAATPPLAAGALLATAVAFGCLLWSFAVNDTSVENVAQNSHSAKPWVYKVAGAWGNHEGSMLLWVTILGLAGGAVALLERRLDEVAGGIATAMRATTEVEYRRGYLTGLVEKEHTIVSQAHRTRARMTGTATKKCSPSYRGMRGDERGALDDLTWGSGKRMNRSGFYLLIWGKRRQDGGQTRGDHGLSRPRRPDHHQVVAAGSSNLGSPFGIGLTSDIAKVESRRRRRRGAERPRKASSLRQPTVTASPAEGLLQRRRNEYVHVRHQCGLCGIARRNDKSCYSLFPCGEKSGDNACYRPNGAVETELA